MRGTFLSALNPLAASTMQQLKKLGGDGARRNVAQNVKSLWNAATAGKGGFGKAASAYFSGKRLVSRLGGETFSSPKWLARGSAPNIARIASIRKGVFGGTAAWAGLNLLDSDSTTAAISRRGMELGVGYGAFSVGRRMATNKFGARALPYTRAAPWALGGLFMAKMTGLI